MTPAPQPSREDARLLLRSLDLIATQGVSEAAKEEEIACALRAAESRGRRAGLEQAANLVQQKRRSQFEQGYDAECAWAAKVLGFTLDEIASLASGSAEQEQGPGVVTGAEGHAASGSLPQGAGSSPAPGASPAARDAAMVERARTFLRQEFGQLCHPDAVESESARYTRFARSECATRDARIADTERLYHEQCERTNMHRGRVAELRQTCEDRGRAMDSAEKRVAELEAEVERLRSAPWPGQGNVVLEAYRAANVDPHCEVPHEDMAELIDRAVRENDRLRAAMDTADRALAYCDEPPRLVAAARSQIRAALRRPEEEQPGAPRQGAKTPDDPEGRSPLVPQVGGRPAGRAPSAASAPPNLAALTGPWKIERDEIGLAVALSRGGVWVVHLREGSFRNNSEGGAEVVCAELNRAASAPREYAETLEYLEWIAENHERQSGQFASGVHWLATELIERLRTAPLASPAGGEARPTCVWSHDDEDGDLWEGTCGVAWSLPNGTPKENGMGWCPKCGEELVEYRAEDFDDAPDQLKEPAPPPATGDVFEFIRMANEMNDLCELEAPWLDSATEYLRSRFGGCVAALENLHRTTRYLATAGGTGIGTRDALKEAERVLSELRAAGAKKKE